jgi:hypothetical protein
VMEMHRIQGAWLVQGRVEVPFNAIIAPVRMKASLKAHHKSQEHRSRNSCRNDIKQASPQELCRDSDPTLITS